MGTIMKKITIMLSLLLVFSGVPLHSAFAAVNDYVTVSKSVDPTSVTTEEEAEVTLNIQGTPPVTVVQPNDVILIIDKSGSMAPGANNGEDKMKAAKDAAKGFIDLMDLTKHQVGIVDFSSSSLTKTFPLTTDASAAKEYVDTITANGSTATGYAIEKAMAELENHRPEARPVIVIMTDGDATEPQKNAYDYAKQWAQSAKDAGITFYTIALLKSSDNPNASGPNQLLKEMATTSSHHHFVLGSSGLKEIYAAIVKEIGMASAYDVVLNDIVSPDFEIVPGSYDNNIPKPTVKGNTLTWEFTELKNNTLTFKYKIKPKDPNKVGILSISTNDAMVSYKDYAGASRTKSIPNVTLQVKYPAPAITSIEKNVGHPDGGETVTITGKHFRTGATVNFGAVAAKNVQILSSDKIVVTTPPGPQGNVAVTVLNTDGQKGSGQYQYKADPKVTTIQPAHGPLSGGTLIFINGNYFMNGMKVKFGDKEVQLDTYAGPTYIKVKAPATTVAGPVDLVFTNPDGSSLTVPGAYTYDAPVVEKLEVTNITPNTGELAGGEFVFLDGKKFAQGVKVYFGGVEAALSSYYSDARIKVKVPAATTPGPVEVKVINPDGENISIKDGYTYKPAPELPAPEITKITPNTGLKAGGDNVTIEGKNFVQGIKVYFGSNEAVVKSFASSTKITVTSPSVAAAGEVEVKVVNPDNKEAILASGFKYLDAPPILPPTIKTISPDNGPLIGGTFVYIDGTEFVQGSKVYFGKVEVPVGAYYSKERIRVTAPAASEAGPVDVKIVNPDGGEGTKNAGYTYNAPPPAPAPVITTITPNSDLLTGGTPVYIDGQNFVQGLKVYFGSTEVPVNVFYSNTRIKVTSPSSSVEGPVDVKFVNPDGKEGIKAAGFTFMKPPPQVVEITKISPDKGNASGGGFVYLDGSNFKQDAMVKFGSNAVKIDYFYSASRVRVKAPSSNGYEGPVDVTVTNGDGQSFTVSNGYTYEIPAPQITGITPKNGPMAGGTFVYIDGINFSPNMTLTIDGKSVPVGVYYSDTRIRITTPASSTSGAVPIVITMPNGATASTTFTYDAPPPTPAPVITKITPTSGPVTGGTYIYVDGTGFINGLKVYMNDIEIPVSYFYSDVRIRLVSPPGNSPGTVPIKFVNPDGKESNTINFEYK
ncbi:MULTISPECIES: IPT/TIG domain-containing protein [Brevibacillus]|uniref:IPT/TIG domain-containing protein n=1 Tax=Brevibacillus TaxID=55080 RepID=UPI00156B0432|nr:IPT/TIG domain-containing protein [Brevibacillus sp. RS1.1]NRR03451.1 IPT/TIG domain-containing protein [Brevibacillus sp. RS1.1]